MNFQGLSEITLAIPAWQVGLYILIVSLFMLRQDRKLCLIVTYLFTLYWVFFLYGEEFVTVTQGSPILLSLFIMFGMLHVFLTLIAFLQER